MVNTQFMSVNRHITYKNTHKLTHKELARKEVFLCFLTNGVPLLLNLFFFSFFVMLNIVSARDSNLKQRSSSLCIIALATEQNQPTRTKHLLFHLFIFSPLDVFTFISFSPSHNHWLGFLALSACSARTP